MTDRTTNALTALYHPANPDFGVFGPDSFIEHHFREGSTWRGNTELPVSMVLYTLALANRSKVIVETGVNNGAGATLWLVFAAMMNGGAYVGIDINQEAIAKATACCTEFIPGAHPTFLHGNASEVVPAAFEPGTIDFLFIDDEHTRAHVEAEIAAFLPCMRSGGLMLFHDVVGVHEPDVWEPVQRAGGVRLVAHQRLPSQPFGGLGLLVAP